MLHRAGYFCRSINEEVVDDEELATLFVAAKRDVVVAVFAGFEGGCECAFAFGDDLIQCCGCITAALAFDGYEAGIGVLIDVFETDFVAGVGLQLER